MKIPEYWVDIPESNNYQVSNYGNVRHLLKSGKYKYLSSYIKKRDSHKSVKIRFKGKVKECFIHKLVASVFLEAQPPNAVLYHKNLIITDNYAGNLAWISREELGKKTGAKTSRSIPVIKLDAKTGEILNFYNSIAAAARDNFIHKETICAVIKGRTKTAAGFKWIKEEIYA